MFGDANAERRVEEKIRKLRQNKSAGQYTAEFRQLKEKINWNDAALRAQYYEGLKKNVKNELARIEWPDDLESLVKLAVKIDDRLYRRFKEKQGYAEPRRTHQGQ